MNAGTFARPTRNPLMNPHAAPQAIATRVPTNAVAQPSAPRFSMTFAAMTLLKTSTAPTDRSMPAVMMTRVAPTPSTAKIAVFMMIDRKVKTVKNASGDMIEKKMSNPTRTRTIWAA